MPVADHPTYPLALQIIQAFRAIDPDLTTREASLHVGVTPATQPRYAVSLYPQRKRFVVEFYGGRPRDARIARSFIANTIAAANAVGCDAQQRGTPRLGHDPLVKVLVRPADFRRREVRELMQSLYSAHA